MSDPYAYTMLIASLPRHSALFAATRTPINRVKLERRLRVLAPEDRAILGRVESVMQWRHLSMSLDDAGFLAQVRTALQQIENETLRLVIRDRLEIRTCVAALRRRQRGETAAPRGAWGFGRWLGHMARNWNEPAFRLEGVFPWLREAERLMRARETIQLERLILQQVWTNLARHGSGHEFDFEAVVIYVLRWNVIERWTQYDGAAAVARFDALVEAALGAHAEMFAEGAG